LQRAAERRDVLAMLFRASRASSCTQAALRLHVSRAQNNTVVRILKRHGGGMPAPVALDLHSTLLRRPYSTRHNDVNGDDHVQRVQPMQPMQHMPQVPQCVARALYQ
jgi:hypothetical protein